MKETLVQEKFDSQDYKRAGWGSFLLPVSLVVCLFAVILVTELGLMTRTKAAVHSEMLGHLRANAQIIDSKIEDLYESIEAVAPTMSFEAGYTQKQMLFGMNALRDARGLDFVVRTNMDGIAFNYMGKENIDLSKRAYIHKALGGNRSIEFVSSGAYDTGNSYVIMAVPIRFNGKVVGVFHGSYKAKNFVALLAKLSNEARRSSDEISIVTSGGDVIASSSVSADNAALASLCGQISSGDADKNYLTYENSWRVRHYYFNRLDAGTGSDWFIVSRMRNDYLSEQTSFARTSAIALLATAILITVALLYIVIGRQRLSNELGRRSVMLSEALDAAESAGRAKSRFLSTVSHEMRTPLNAIIGFVELSKGAGLQQIERYLANMRIASKQLLSVINDVLDMSSIESGKMTITNEPFDFQQLIHSVTNIFVSQCHDKGIEYETRLLTHIDEWLVGDQLRVNQILINLLGNAVKFTSSGHIWLSVSQTAAQGNKVYVRFEVSDTGCGMSEEMQLRMFKPFEQEDPATAQKYGGSGLGLSIVKNLVGLMGGAISVRSARGEGSVFTVDIPFVRGEAATGINVPVGVETLRVLVVDDELMERDYISAVLTRMGARFACVSGCDEALEELAKAAEQNDSYNICLVDWRMPKTDGVETTRRIREKYGENVVVIVVSAYDHNQANENAKRAGANFFIPKPLFQSSLFDLFMTITGGHFAKTEEPLEEYDFTGRRVLLAEDNQLNQIVTEGLLEKVGVVCEIAEDGRTALDMFTSSEPGYYDAILMDVQMPSMNGLEATKLIRSSNHPDAQTVQIIALTANAFDDDVAQALSTGMNAHVSKPIEVNEFVSTLDRAFNANKG
ncbi:MAG: response regulator [Synergistaceae bacterium]|nr:response regulator [Synergistaceae bacterium]